VSATLDHLNAHRKVIYTSPVLGTMTATRPRIACADGFSMSVQAGVALYSSPRDDAESYSMVEIGFPSERVDEFMKYAEDPDKPTDTVYAYVPVGIVDAVIARHGGVAS
jgi:hypothetical protein